MTPLHFAFLMLINVAWGFNIVPVKLALETLPPITAALVRFALLLLLCLPFLKWLPGKMGRVLVTGFVIGALNFAVMNYAFAIATNMGALAIATQLGVPFSLILAIGVLGERIRWIRTVGIVLAFGGVAVMSFDPAVFDQWPALLLVTFSAFIYAVGNIMMRQMTGVPALTLQAWVAAVSVVPLLLLSLLVEPGALQALPDAPARVFGYLLFAAAFSSVIGHAGIAWLLQRYPVTVISPFTLLSPLLSVLFSVLLLDSPLTGKMMIGGCITLVGVGIITFRGARKEEERP